MDILITGTTRGGIGFETARILLQKGHRVFIVNRNKQKTEETVRELAQYGRVEKAADELELEDLDSVRRFAKEFKLPALNCLINNAGIMAVPELRRTRQGHEQHVGVNHLAHFLLTRLLLGRLVEGAKKSGVPSRVVNVSSHAYLFAKSVDIRAAFKSGDNYDAQQQYSYSKLFQLWDTADVNRAFAANTNQPLVIAFALHPGVILTNLTREMPKDAVESLKDSPGWKFLTPTEGAATTIFCATATLDELKCSPPLSDHESRIPFCRDAMRDPKLTRLAKDVSKCEELIRFSEELTGVSVSSAKL